MAALVVVKPFRICPMRPLKNRKGKFDYAFTIAINSRKSREIIPLKHELPERLLKEIREGE